MALHADPGHTAMLTFCGFSEKVQMRQSRWP